MKKNKLDIAKNLLSSGELVIFPTETVFGLGADATNDEAVKSIFEVKKRPRSNPIICHFKSIKQIEEYFILNKSNNFDMFEQINHFKIPGGNMFRRPLYSSAIIYYRLMDYLNRL